MRWPHRGTNYCKPSSRLSLRNKRVGKQVFSFSEPHSLSSLFAFLPPLVPPSLSLSHWYTSEAEDGKRCVFCVASKKSILYFSAGWSLNVQLYIVTSFSVGLFKVNLFLLVCLWLSRRHRCHVRLARTSYETSPLPTLLHYTGKWVEEQSIIEQVFMGMFILREGYNFPLLLFFCVDVVNESDVFHRSCTSHPIGPVSSPAAPPE